MNLSKHIIIIVGVIFINIVTSTEINFQRALANKFDWLLTQYDNDQNLNNQTVYVRKHWPCSCGLDYSSSNRSDCRDNDNSFCPTEWRRRTSRRGTRENKMEEKYIKPAFKANHVCLISIWRIRVRVRIRIII